MRAFVTDRQTTKFMQAADMFNSNKVVYADLELKYGVKNVKGEEITDEESILFLAKIEFGDDLIALMGKDKPLYINPKVQVISNGKQWVRLIDALKQLYPNVEFKHSDRFTEIEVVDNLQLQTN